MINSQKLLPLLCAKESVQREHLSVRAGAQYARSHAMVQAPAQVHDHQGSKKYLKKSQIERILKKFFITKPELYKFSIIENFIF